MRKITLALFAFLVLFAVQAQAQFLVQETLIDSTDVTSSTIEPGPMRYEHPSSPHTVWYFKLKVTALSAGGMRLYLQYYDKIDDEWDVWMSHPGQLDATGEVVCVFIGAPGITDHNTLVTEASNDIDAVYLVPLPAIWRVGVLHNGASTASYTVTHWRY